MAAVAFVPVQGAVVERFRDLRVAGGAGITAVLVKAQAARVEGGTDEFCGVSRLTSVFSSSISACILAA